MSSWQPIATWNTNRTDKVFFWVVPKTPEEAYTDTSGDPIVGAYRPRLFWGRYKTWSSLEKATHWMEAPNEPEPPSAGE